MGERNFDNSYSTTRIFMLKMKQAQAILDRPVLRASFAFTSTKDSGHPVAELHPEL